MVQNFIYFTTKCRLAFLKLQLVCIPQKFSTIYITNNKMKDFSWSKAWWKQLRILSNTEPKPFRLHVFFLPTTRCIYFQKTGCGIKWMGYGYSKDILHDIALTWGSRRSNMAKHNFHEAESCNAIIKVGLIYWCCMKNLAAVYVIVDGTI